REQDRSTRYRQEQEERGEHDGRQRRRSYFQSSSLQDMSWSSARTQNSQHCSSAVVRLNADLRGSSVPRSCRRQVNSKSARSPLLEVAVKWMKGPTISTVVISRLHSNVWFAAELQEV